MLTCSSHLLVECARVSKFFADPAPMRLNGLKYGLKSGRHIAAVAD
jgi:hypothetical protein